MGLNVVRKGILATVVGLLAAGLMSPTAMASTTQPDQDSLQEADQTASQAVIVSSDAAVAAASPYFRIFYGENCYSGGTSGRAYFGYNSGEAWINDRFESAGAGYNQLIRQNAASVWVVSGQLLLSRDGGYSWRSYFGTSGGVCFNLDNSGMRNQNTNWMMK